jgi:hypothetical protein
MLSLYGHFIFECNITNCSQKSASFRLFSSLCCTLQRPCTPRLNLLVDSDRIRSRSELGIASREHLCTRLHSLQVQARRESIAPVIR